MNWMSWKTWTVAGVIIIAVFAIYTFAAPEPPQITAMAGNDPSQDTANDRPAAPGTTARRPPVVRTPGVDPVHTEWLVRDGGSYSSNRNLFGFPAPPPPPPPPKPVPPPDKDKDGVPDFQDNCPSAANPDQSDVDRDGIGTACETALPEIAPPPPPPPKPVPPAFPYKYIGTFGNPATPIATFTGNGEIINARVGDVLEGKFILRGIGIESVEIGFIGFPADERQRIPLGQ
jgi:hypothetical protein